LTFEEADPDRYTCDTCLADLDLFTLWHDLKCKFKQKVLGWRQTDRAGYPNCKVEDVLEALGWSQTDYAEHLDTSRHVLGRDRKREIPPPYHEDPYRNWETPLWTPDLEAWADNGTYLIGDWYTIPPTVRERITPIDCSVLNEINDAYCPEANV
jgi:hypothetical protein